MLQIRKAGVGLILILCTLFFNKPLVAQYPTYSHPMSDIYQKGLTALKNGDTLTAFANIQSAYNFMPTQEDIKYYYLTLALTLDKPFAESLTIKWLENTDNKIYKSRLHFHLGKYYFKKQKDEASLKSFSYARIEDLDNVEIAQMKYEQGYLYFKNGSWEKATSLLNTVRQLENSPYYTDANYYAGFIALEQKKFNEALQYFQVASTNKAYSRLTPFYISQLYYFLGDMDAAMLNCQKALETSGQYYELSLKQLMGHLWFEKKDFSKALPYLKEYIEKQKKSDPQDLYQLSFCYFQSQNWQNAIEGFKELANIEDSLGQNSMYLLATSYLKLNNKTGAKNAFLICSTKNLNISQKEISLFNYAKLCAELKEYTNAINAFDKFMDTYPNSIFAEEAKSYWIAALTLSNNYIQAIKAYESIQNPSIDLLKLYPKMLYGRATIYINEGQIELAFSLLNKILNTPYNAKILPQAQFWLGELLYKMSRVDESIEILEKFIKDPVELPEVNQRHAKYTLGYGYLKKGNYQKAADYFNMVSKYNHSNMFESYQKDAYIRLADCQMMLKQYKLALTTFQKAIDENWDYNDYATLQKAMILGGMGQINDKIKILTDFENQFSKSVYINDANMELADTYSNKENFQDAIAPLTKILLDTNAINYYPQAYYKLGIVYFNLNKNQVALSTFKDLFNAFPKSLESDNSIEFVRNIYIEDQTPDLFVEFMNAYGRSLSLNEQDSLSYRASIIKFEQKKYTEALQGFSKYLLQFPNGKYQLEANNVVGEIAYSQQNYDTAVKYFGMVANQAPNKYAERASLIAARLNYFNFQNYTNAEKYFNTLLNITTQQENKLEALKGLLRCQYKNENWEACSIIAKQILQDKSSASDDIIMSNMALYHQSVITGDTTGAIQLLSKIINTNSSVVTAEAHYLLAKIYLDQNKLAIAEKTSFEVIKKQAAYEFWVTKAYILLGDIYAAQNDNFNAIATYKSVSENANIDSLKLEAKNKLNMLVEKSNLK